MSEPTGLAPEIAPLVELLDRFDPPSHPVVGPLLRGGPEALGALVPGALEGAAGWADACHLCYTARLALRERIPSLLVPDQVYGGFAA